ATRCAADARRWDPASVTARCSDNHVSDAVAVKISCCRHTSSGASAILETAQGETVAQIIYRDRSATKVGAAEDDIGLTAAAAPSIDTRGSDDDVVKAVAIDIAAPTNAEANPLQRATICETMQRKAAVV